MRRYAILTSINLALLLAMIATPSHGSPFNGTSGTISCSSGYVTVSNGVLTGNNNCYGHVDVPYPVTSIGPSAFSGATRLTAIYLPATVVSIGDSAFSGATSLELLSFPTGSRLTTIGDSAFKGADFTYITIPASVTSIGDSAYYGTQALTVTFETGSVLETIGPAAFHGATRLASLNIPKTVKTIGTYAFYEATNLATLTFADDSKLTSIGGSAFYNATRLTSIAIPSSVTLIEELAFYRATNLQTLTFGTNSSLTYIGSNAFRHTTSLTSVSIPPKVTYIDFGAFSGATQLATVTFENSSQWVQIRPSAFYDATSLTSVFFLGDAPNEALWGFDDIGTAAKVFISSSARGFGSVGDYWQGLHVHIGVYSVTYNSKNGTEISSGSFIPGDSISRPSPPTRSGYTFAGWLSSDGGTEVSFPYNPGVISDITLYAKWFPNVYTITYNYNSATSGNGVSSENFTTGATAITLPAPSRSGYTFAGWYEDARLVTKIGDAGASYSPNGVNLAISAYAKWIANAANNPQPQVADNSAATAAAADLALRTVKAKKLFVAKTLAKRVGVKSVSSKATVTMSVAKSSKKICSVSKSKLKTLKTGKCVVTFTVQEPKPKKGKKPKATKTTKTLIVR